MGGATAAWAGTVVTTLYCPMQLLQERLALAGIGGLAQARGMPAPIPPPGTPDGPPPNSDSDGSAEACTPPGAAPDSPSLSAKSRRLKYATVFRAARTP